MLDKYDGNMKPTSEITNSIHAGDKVSALVPPEENISRTDDEDLDALFHDGSDDEGNPGRGNGGGSRDDDSRGSGRGQRGDD